MRLPPMPVLIDQRGRVRASVRFEVPLPAATVWQAMRDWRRFITIDPLHARVDLLSPPPSPTIGAEFLLEHRLLGISVTRRARMLRWREGREFAFSDLSWRGNRNAAGFPHVCMYQVEPRGETSARIR